MRRRSTVGILIALVILSLLVIARNKKQISSDEVRSSSSARDANRSSSVPDPSQYTLGSGDFNRSMRFGGREREYRIHVPSSYEATTPHALIIVFHGGGGDIQSAVRSMEWDNTSDQEGFLVVYPQGTGKKALGRLFGTWNGGICCGLAAKEKIDDVGFTNAMIDAIAKEFHINQKRIYATGISNGGMMSYRLACDLSNRIAAIGPVAGQFDGGQECHPSRPVPILHLHGLVDPCTKMEGGTCGGCFNEYLKALHIPAEKNDTWQCTPVENTVRTWAMRNGCSGERNIISKRGGVTCVSFGCSDQVDTELCTVEDLGHQWPGGDNEVQACATKPNGLACTSWKKTVGPESDALSANDVLWTFFMNHSMK